MDGSHLCTSCGLSLPPEDGHDLCPTCLGPEHLREALSGDPCMDCSYLPRAVRAARLAGVEGPAADAGLPPSGQPPSACRTRSKRRAETAATASSKKRARSGHGRMSAEVERLSAELAQMRSLLAERQPDAPLVADVALSPPMPALLPEEDTLSLAASASHFCEYGAVPGGETSPPSEQGSRSSAQTSGSEMGDGSMRAVMRLALERLNTPVPQQAEAAPASAFFRRRPASTAFAIPHSVDYLKELQTCWRDSKACSRLSADGRTLAAMHDAAVAGLDCMPAVEPAISSLIVAPDEALRRDARCPRAQCRITDDLITRAYDVGARAARMGNSLSHLMLALSASLQDSSVTADAHTFCDASLEAFGLISRELGRLMSILVQARRQVWLSQSNLTEAARRMLRSLPVEPGQVFGPAAQEALERTVQAGQTRQATPPVVLGFSVPPRDHAGTFWILPTCSPGSFVLQGRSVPPLGPQGAGGPEIEALGPAVGCFSHRQLQQWAARSLDPWVVATLTHGYRLQFRRRPPTSRPVVITSISDPAKALALDQELAALLAKGAIEPVDPLACSGGFYSTYFLVAKPTGFRPILDLRALNSFLKVMPFHMLTTADVLHTVAQGDWFTSIDLKDAYFHIPIAWAHRRFLRFAYRGCHWQFRVLPFGLSLSPRVFTRCMAAALAPLQARGLKVLPYLDDWLVCAPSRAQVSQDTELLLSHVAQLGLKVNVEKSCLVPSQAITFIGVSLDSVAMTARPSTRRVDDIFRHLALIREGRWLAYVSFLRLLGKLTSISGIVPLGLLSLRPLQRWLNGFRLDAKRHRCRKLRVSRQCLHALAPWRDRAYMLRGVPMGSVPSRRETVTTDACPLGWGAVWQGRTARGWWPLEDQGAHINVLELRAVHLALRHFLPHLRDKHVLVRSDNTSVVYHINHQGGTRSAQLLAVTRELLTWAAPRLVSLRAMHLPGEQNRLADFLSRQKPPSGEWRLHPEVVSTIWGLFGRAEVDLFASEASTHCPLWFSLAETTSPLGQDALAHPWPDGLLYAFPPMPLIRHVLQRVLQEGHRVLLIAPFWPGRSWFPLLHSLCRNTQWRLPDRFDLLSQMAGQIWHPDPHRLRLCVWPLEGPRRC
ncbi:uncharacterized protein LOC141804210 [Halichoeres trimaculatus]|uniref:uncharacterized protein LOC141804210 n=1 Tax=Halichoeres trimaculatus TaxID=147232 RepID=UPI003D9E7025